MKVHAAPVRAPWMWTLAFGQHRIARRHTAMQQRERRRWRHSRKAGGGSKFSAVPSRERRIRRGSTMDATPAIPHHRRAVPVMRKLLLGSIAALFLATGTAHADNEKWEARFRQCHIRKWFSKDELAAIGWARETEGQTIVIEAEEIPDILKAIGVIKKCKAFYQCLEDRDRGKVKHCYENDRRWR